MDSSETDNYSRRGAPGLPGGIVFGKKPCSACAELVFLTVGVFVQ
jgi:hypothetical protein